MKCVVHSRRARFGRVVAATLLLAATGMAQDSRPTSADALPPRIAFTDKNLGYELEIPAGWMYDRTGFFGPLGSVGLLRGAAPDGSAMIQLLAFRDVQIQGFNDWVAAFTEQLRGVPGLVWARSTGDASSKRPAAFIVAEARDGLERLRTSYYAVQFDGATNWMLSYSTPLDRGGEATKMPAEDALLEMAPPMFRAIAGSLRVFYSEALATSLSEGLDRGKKYVSEGKLKDDAAALRVSDKPRCFMIEMAGKPIGYLTRVVTSAKQSLDEPRYAEKGKDGVRIRETSWRFADDGSVRHGVIDLFSSLDGQTDLFDIWEATVPADAAAPPLTTRDQCIREGDVLFSSVLSSQMRGLPPPRQPIRVNPSYLGLAWVRLLPALLGTRCEALHAFSVYDPETRALLTQSIRYIGVRAVPGESKPAREFEVRDGFADQAATLLTDEHGQLLRLEGGALVLRLCTEAEVEKAFAARRDAARKRLEASAKP